MKTQVGIQSFTDRHPANVQRLTVNPHAHPVNAGVREGETEGEWIQETVLPSQALLDPGIWSDFLGWSESKVYWSRRALTDAVTAFLEPTLS